MMLRTVFLPYHLCWDPKVTLRCYLLIYLEMDGSGYLRSAEEYVSRLEEMAKKDLFDPSKYTFDANIKYLDSLIKMSKECSLKGNLEDGYIGFRRFQIVLSCLQQHNLYDPEDPHIKQLNMVDMKWLC